MFAKGVSVEQARKMSKEQQEQLLKKIEQDAHDIEARYWGCSRAVLLALQRNFNLGNGDVAKAVAPFPGGIARMREACGALIGGVMAIGLAYATGKTEEGKVFLEQATELEALVRASKFGERFKEKFGCVRCEDVRAAVRGGAKGHNTFNNADAFEDHVKCADATGPAARMAAEVILQPSELFAAEVNVFLEDLKKARQQQKSKR